MLDPFVVPRNGKELTTKMLDLEANTVNGTYTGPIVEVNDKHVVQRLNDAARILHERAVLKEQAPQINAHVRIAYSARIPTVTPEAPARAKGISQGLHV